MGGYECHLFHKVLGAILNTCQKCHSLSVKGGMKFRIIFDYFSYQLSQRIYKALVYPESNLPFFHKANSIVVEFHTNLIFTPVRNWVSPVLNCYNRLVKLQKHRYGKYAQLITAPIYADLCIFMIVL